MAIRAPDGAKKKKNGYSSVGHNMKMLVKTALVQYQKMLVSFQMKILVTGQHRSGRISDRPAAGI